MLFLQVPDPISGGAGWMGAGLLGLVLAWLLLKHLPAKDEQITGLVAAKDKQLADIMDKYNERLDRQRGEFMTSLVRMADTFKTESSAERLACERHFENLSGTISQAFKTLGDQLAAQAQQSHDHSTRNQQWLELLRGELAKRPALAKES